MFGSQRSIERRLSKNASRLAALRADLNALAQQVTHLADEADDLATRAIVSDDPSVGPEARRAREHADTQARQVQRLRAEIVKLEAEQDQLLDRWSGAPG